MSVARLLGAVDDGIDLRPADGPGCGYVGWVDGQPFAWSLRDGCWECSIGDRWTAEGDGATGSDAYRVVHHCVAEWRASRREGSA